MAGSPDAVMENGPPVKRVLIAVFNVLGSVSIKIVWIRVVRLVGLAGRLAGKTLTGLLAGWPVSQLAGWPAGQLFVPSPPAYQYV
eukprot:1790008-Heterocapsa_arctica.AAC.1